MENKFLWLCAFIDVLETLYVVIYQIGSFPLIFLRSWCLQPLANLFHWIWIICKVCDAETVYVTEWWEHSWNPQRKVADALQPKGSTAEPVAGGLPVLPTGLRSLAPHGLTTPPTPPPSTQPNVQMHSTRKLILDTRSSVNKARLLLRVSLFHDSLTH